MRSSFRQPLIRLPVFIVFFLITQNVSGQKDSLVKYCRHIKPGMSETAVDSLMHFYIGNMHKAPGGTWRYIYNTIYQSTTEYQDREWNSYTFRYLFEMNRLIYFDLHYYKTNSILYSQMDSGRVRETVNSFNKKYNSSDSFHSILTSFHTTVYSLGKLDDFFSTATDKDKMRLWKYAKSLCPEYSASAMIRLLELEREKPFLTALEKAELTNIMTSDVTIKFMIGCLYRVLTFPEFISAFRPELKLF